MKMTRSRRFASVGVAALLSLPIAALAQSAPAAAPVPAASSAAPSSVTQPGPGKNAEQRVERRIGELHAQLQITSAEQQSWDQFTKVMRENAREMDRAFIQRADQYPSMTAVQNMQSYEDIAEIHARQLQKLVPAFQNLYDAMSDQQKQVADQVFRAKAQAHEQRHHRS